MHVYFRFSRNVSRFGWWLWVALALIETRSGVESKIRSMILWSEGQVTETHERLVHNIITLLQWNLLRSNPRLPPTTRKTKKKKKHTNLAHRFLSERERESVCVCVCFRRVSMCGWVDARDFSVLGALSLMDEPSRCNGSMAPSLNSGCLRRFHHTLCRNIYIFLNNNKPTSPHILIVYVVNEYRQQHAEPHYEIVEVIKWRTPMVYYYLF